MVLDQRERSAKTTTWVAKKQSYLASSSAVESRRSVDLLLSDISWLWIKFAQALEHVNFR